MNASAVQEERGPRRQNFEIIKKSSRVKVPLQEHHETLVNILVTCITEARKNQHFKELEKSQQNSILKKVWSECFILRVSHWSISMDELMIKSVFEDKKIIVD